MSEGEDLHKLVGGYYERVDDGDVAGLLALFDKDVVYRRPGYEPIVGISDLHVFYESERVIERGQHSLHSMLVEGDEVAVRGDFAGVLKTGKQVRIRFADFFRVAKGRIIERNTYFDSPAV